MPIGTLKSPLGKGVDMKKKKPKLDGKQIWLTLIFFVLCLVTLMVQLTVEEQAVADRSPSSYDQWDNLKYDTLGFPEGT